MMRVRLTAVLTLVVAFAGLTACGDDDAATTTTVALTTTSTATTVAATTTTAPVTTTLTAAPTTTTTVAPPTTLEVIQLDETDKKVITTLYLPGMIEVEQFCSRLLALAAEHSDLDDDEFQARWDELGEGLDYFYRAIQGGVNPDALEVLEGATELQEETLHSLELLIRPLLNDWDDVGEDGDRDLLVRTMQQIEGPLELYRRDLAEVLAGLPRIGIGEDVVDEIRAGPEAYEEAHPWGTGTVTNQSGILEVVDLWWGWTNQSFYTEGQHFYAYATVTNPDDFPVWCDEAVFDVIGGDGSVISQSIGFMDGILFPGDTWVLRAESFDDDVLREHADDIAAVMATATSTEDMDPVDPADLEVTLGQVEPPGGMFSAVDAYGTVTNRSDQPVQVILWAAAFGPDGSVLGHGDGTLGSPKDGEWWHESELLLEPGDSHTFRVTLYPRDEDVDLTRARIEVRPHGQVW